MSAGDAVHLSLPLSLSLFYLFPGFSAQILTYRFSTMAIVLTTITDYAVLA